MTTLRFVGDLPAWLGIILALLGAGLALAYYRRESFDLPKGLRWFLPTLRALAIWMVIVILTGPVLHHRKEVGQLGSVRLLVDTSQSMTVADPQMPLARKLRVAQAQGWLPEGQFDSRLSDLADRINVVRLETLKALDNEAVTKEQVVEIREEFIAQVTQLNTLVEAMQTSVRQMSAKLEDDQAGSIDPAAVLQSSVMDEIDNLNSVAIENDEQSSEVRNRLLLLAGKLQPLAEHYETAFEGYCQAWLQSEGDAARAALQLFDQSLRIKRIESRLLAKESGLLARLKDQHHVDVAALVGDEEVAIWSSRGTSEMPESFDHIASAMRTNLAGGLIESGDASVGDATDEPVATGAATVLFSDGQHNAGPSPMQIAGVAKTQQNLIYTVGFGTQNEPTDLVMLDARYPDTVHKTDQIRGTLVLKDRMREGLPFVVQISDGKNVVWQDELKSLNVAQRQIEFSFPVEPLVDAAGERFEADVQHHSMPIELTARIVPVDGETDTANNVKTLRFAAITQRQRLLLIDSRSRWETRYLKNLFERDSGWELNSIILESGTGNNRLQRGESDGMFPTSKDELFEYDFIIFGDVAPSTFNAGEIIWLQDFVESRGGGIIFIDGVRKELHRMQADSLGVLLPVSWLPDAEVKKADRLVLTDIGDANPALTLVNDAGENSEFWEQLPAPSQVIPGKPTADAEVLVEAVVGNETLPVIIGRSFGAGRVLYFATDETWRWRYRVADQFHQRFWNQIARWVMPRPYAVSDQYLALDAGATRYDAGAVAPLRVQLRGPDGKLVSDTTVDALVWKDGQIVSTISMSPEPNMPGSYRAETGPLAPGDYEVTIRAGGFNESAFQAKTGFVVAEPSNKELEQIACNEALLTDMASAGGGEYLREEDVDKIVELLEPLSAGRVIESDTLLWQSWPWFLGIVGLLSVEWLLRKRNGLL
ncbi:MAG: hypothetical protein R3C05_29290 [Pirellulaceae bacterium]